MRRRDLLTGTVGGAVDACHQQRDQCARFNHLADSRASWLSAVDILISTLKAAGIWSTFDLFYCFAASNANACAFNWVDTSVGPLTAHGALSCDFNAYTASDGSTGYSRRRSMSIRGARRMAMRSSVISV
jgi:hypothetical protein